MLMRHKQTRLLNLYREKLSEYLKTHNIDLSVEEMLLAITEADPDQAQFKNSKWLINNLLNEKFLWEDIASGKSSKAFDTLDRFLKIRQQWPENNFRDINQYQGLSSIAQKIRPFEIKKTSGDLKREERARVYDETIVVYDKDDYLVVVPKTRFASCYWGRNTEWCTAATRSTNYFDSYNKDGPLIIAITPDNRKYQFHCTCEPMDENDDEIKNIDDSVLRTLAVLTNRYKNIENIDKSNQEEISKAVKYHPELFCLLSPKQEDYHEICIDLANKSRFTLEMLESIPKDIKGYNDMVSSIIIVMPELIDYFYDDHQRYKEFAINLCSQYNSFSRAAIPKIEKLDSNHPMYPEIVLELSKRDRYRLSKKSPGILSKMDENIQRIVVDNWIKDKTEVQNYNYLNYDDIPLTMIGRKELIQYLVRKNPIILTDIPISDADYRDYCFASVSTSAEAISHVNPKHPCCLEMYNLSIEKHGYCYSKSILFRIEDPDVYPILKKLIQEDPSCINSVDYTHPFYHELAREAFILGLIDEPVSEDYLSEEDIKTGIANAFKLSPIRSMASDTSDKEYPFDEYYSYVLDEIKNSSFSGILEIVKPQFLTRELYTQAVIASPNNLAYIPRDIPYYRDLCRTALRENPFCLENILSKYSNNDQERIEYIKFVLEENKDKIDLDMDCYFLSHPIVNDMSADYLLDKISHNDTALSAISSQHKEYQYIVEKTLMDDPDRMRIFPPASISKELISSLYEKHPKNVNILTHMPIDELKIDEILILHDEGFLAQGKINKLSDDKIKKFITLVMDKEPQYYKRFKYSNSMEFLLEYCKRRIDQDITFISYMETDEEMKDLIIYAIEKDSNIIEIVNKHRDDYYELYDLAKSLGSSWVVKYEKENVSEWIKNKYHDQLLIDFERKLSESIQLAEYIIGKEDKKKPQASLCRE